MAMSGGKYVFIPDNEGDSLLYKKEEDGSKEMTDQIAKFGLADDETFSLDASLAKFILPRLYRFRELLNGHPIEMTFEQWTGIIDEIIWFFEQYETDFDCPEGTTQEEYDERCNKAQWLFGEYLRSLWW